MVAEHEDVTRGRSGGRTSVDRDGQGHTKDGNGPLLLLDIRFEFLFLFDEKPTPPYFGVIQLLLRRTKTFDRSVPVGV